MLYEKHGSKVYMTNKNNNKLIRKKTKQRESRSPWRTLTKTVNQLTRIARQKKDSASYLERAEMVRLKRLIGKLKDDLKEAQKTNLELGRTNDDLVEQLQAAASQLARVSDALKDISTSLSPETLGDE